MLKNQIWISEPAFLVDLLKYMNKLNLKLQGKNQFIRDVWFHIQSFEIKFTLTVSYWN